MNSSETAIVIEKIYSWFKDFEKETELEIVKRLRKRVVLPYLLFGLPLLFISGAIYGYAGTHLKEHFLGISCVTLFYVTLFLTTGLFFFCIFGVAYIYERKKDRLLSVEKEQEKYRENLSELRLKINTIADTSNTQRILQVFESIFNKEKGAAIEQLTYLLQKIDITVEKNIETSIVRTTSFNYSLGEHSVTCTVISNK
ncbi:MAG: hypothetical protein JWM20_319 [Patescibacteria group bacterium]|nr:hypothetical protein [Patescibacteria group bacterium]